MWQSPGLWKWELERPQDWGLVGASSASVRGAEEEERPLSTDLLLAGRQSPDEMGVLVGLGGG